MEKKHKKTYNELRIEAFKVIEELYNKKEGYYKICYTIGKDYGFSENVVRNFLEIIMQNDEKMDDDKKWEFFNNKKWKFFV